MEHSYQILQLKEEKRNLLFNRYEEVKETFDISNYNVVYEGKILSTDDVKPMTILEHLFHRFNAQRPSDFKGHSLSISDVILLDGECYYCDTFGWEYIVMTKVESK